MSNEDVQHRTGRSAWGKVALVATAVSAVGLVIMLVGNVTEASGFTDDPNDNSLAADLVWLSFSLGGVVALVTGIISWVLGAKRGRPGDVRAGQVAIGYFVLAIVVMLLFDAFVA